MSGATAYQGTDAFVTEAGDETSAAPPGGASGDTNADRPHTSPVAGSIAEVPGGGGLVVPALGSAAVAPAAVSSNIPPSAAGQSSVSEVNGAGDTAGTASAAESSSGNPILPVGSWHFIDEAQSRLAAREARRVLRQAATRWERRRADEDASLDTFLWLRAARAAWLSGTMDIAQRWYSRAADELLDLALGQGSNTGTYSYYAELALSSASLADRSGVLARAADVIRTHPAPPPTQRPRVRFGRAPTLAAGAIPPEAPAVAHEILRAWGAWIAGDKRDATLAVVGAARASSSLPHQEDIRWRSSHWPEILSAFEGFVDGNGDRVASALTALDYKLAPTLESPGEPRHRSQSLQPMAEDALPSLLVQETLIALAAEWRRNFPRSYSAEGFRLPIEPGALAPYMDGGVIEGAAASEDVDGTFAADGTNAAVGDASA